MRRWLSLYALSVTSVVIIAFLVPLAVLIRDLAADRALNAAEREAQTIARFASTVDGGEESVATLAATLAAAPGTSVVLSDGEVLGTATPAGIDLTAARESGQAYRQSLDGSEAVVVPVLRGAGLPWIVVVSVPADELADGVASAWLVLGGLGFGLIVVAFLVADRMGRAVVEPIRDLVEATQRLGRGELTVAVEPGGPRELADVGRAFNTLTGKVSALMDKERETAADLSHRLRTPMTALKLDIESIGERVDVSRLHSGVDELERVVTHVINEARRSVRDQGDVISDLSSIVAERTDFWGALGADQGRSRTLDIDSGPFPVRAAAEDLEAMLDAALGNIFAHTEPGVRWRVALQRVSGCAELVIADCGDGIGDADLLERGNSGGASTGLGIDIVRGIAAATGGSAEWRAGEESGTVVRILLPLVSAELVR